MITSCHDVSEGGIGVCLSEMCLAGNLGATIELSKLGGKLRMDFRLFSESNTRWLVEVPQKYQKPFEHHMKQNKTSFVLLGKTGGSQLVVKENDKTVIKTDLDVLRQHWMNPIHDFMG
jgi:phosphoribosylformylglycinamidine synthase